MAGILRLTALMGIIITLSACATSEPSMPTESNQPKMATITGTASYRERIALSPNAVFEVFLEDVSRQDAKSIVIGQSRIAPAGMPPYHFTIDYDASKIDSRFSYAVRAKITEDGRLLFTTDTSYPVITRDNPNTVELLLKMIPTTQNPAN